MYGIKQDGGWVKESPFIEVDGMDSGVPLGLGEGKETPPQTERAMLQIEIKELALRITRE